MTTLGALEDVKGVYENLKKCGKGCVRKHMGSRSGQQRPTMRSNLLDPARGLWTRSYERNWWPDLRTPVGAGFILGLIGVDSGRRDAM